MNRFFILLLLLATSTQSFSQEQDSSSYVTDSTYIEEDFEDEEDSYAPPDSTVVDARNFDSKTLEELKADPCIAIQRATNNCGKSMGSLSIVVKPDVRSNF